MIITYHGLEFFKIQQGDLTIAINPPSKKSQFSAPRFGADIVLVSNNNPDMNGAEEMSHGDKVPFIITGPGEYEIKEVFIRGLPDKENTIYTLSVDGIDICFLGALSSKELAKNNLEALDNIDILFLPIGGAGVIGPDEAYKLSVALEPNLVIPMHYLENNPKPLKAFLKEAGEEVKPLEKLVIKKKDLEGKEGEVVVLKTV